MMENLTKVQLHNAIEVYYQMHKGKGKDYIIRHFWPALERIGLNTVPTVLTVLTVHPALLQITYKLTVHLQRTSFGPFLGHRTPQEIPYTSMETLFNHFWATVHLNKYRTPQWKCFLTNSGPPYTSIDTVHLPGNFFVSFLDHRTPQWKLLC